MASLRGAVATFKLRPCQQTAQDVLDCLGRSGVPGATHEVVRRAMASLCWRLEVLEQLAKIKHQSGVADTKSKSRRAADGVPCVERRSDRQKRRIACMLLDTAEQCASDGSTPLTPTAASYMLAPLSHVITGDCRRGVETESIEPVLRILDLACASE